VPRLWDESVDAHRHEVRRAVVDAAGRLVSEGGLRAVTMSGIAHEAKIGRATLYRYFHDLDEGLHAWHETQINEHLAELVDVRDRTEPGDRLHAVLEAYALLSHRAHIHHDTELEVLLHRDQRVHSAREHVRALVRDLIAEATLAGTVRDDTPPDELAAYCIHALNAAAGLQSTVAVRRLVAIVLDGLK
jgi:AcrR family transcriptional regulator